MLLVARLNFQRALWFAGRALADGVNHTAGRRFTVQNRGRAFQEIHPLNAKRLIHPPEVAAGAE